MKCKKIKISCKHLKLDLTFSEKYKKLFFPVKSVTKLFQTDTKINSFRESIRNLVA